MESTVREMSSTSPEVESYHSPDLSWDLDYDENLARFRHHGALVVDEILSAPSTESRIDKPIFSFKKDPIDQWDHPASYNYRANAEINLDHWVACGVIWTDEQLRKGSHFCRLRKEA